MPWVKDIHTRLIKKETHKKYKFFVNAFVTLKVWLEIFRKNKIKPTRNTI